LPPDPAQEAAPAGPLALAPVMSMLAILVLLATFAGPVTGYLEATATQLFEPEGYLAMIPDMPDAPAKGEQ